MRMVQWSTYLVVLLYAIIMTVVSGIIVAMVVDARDKVQTENIQLQAVNEALKEQVEDLTITDTANLEWDDILPKISNNGTILYDFSVSNDVDGATFTIHFEKGDKLQGTNDAR